MLYASDINVPRGIYNLHFSTGISVFPSREEDLSLRQPSNSISIQIIPVFELFLDGKLLSYVFHIGLMRTICWKSCSLGDDLRLVEKQLSLGIMDGNMVDLWGFSKGSPWRSLNVDSFLNIALTNFWIDLIDEASFQNFIGEIA